MRGSIVNGEYMTYAAPRGRWGKGRADYVYLRPLCSDHGSPYVAMRYTERLADAGAADSVVCAGDAYDSALAKA